MKNQGTISAKEQNKKLDEIPQEHNNIVYRNTLIYVFQQPKSCEDNGSDCNYYMLISAYDEAKMLRFVLSPPRSSPMATIDAYPLS